MGITSTMVQVGEKLWLNPAHVWGVRSEAGVTLIFVADQQPPFRSDWGAERVIAALGLDK